MQGGSRRKSVVRTTSRRSDALPLGKGVTAYVAMAKKLGFVEGKLGKQSVSGRIEPLVKAMHKVLAGATITRLDVGGTYDKATVRKLGSLMNGAMKEANRINVERGSDVAFG